MRWRRTSALVAGMVSFQSQLAPAQDESVCSQSEVRVPKTEREFKRLRSHARTAPEFRALAGWCDSRADECQAKQIRCEVELRQYYEHPPIQPVKFPRRDEVLNVLIASYKSQVARWKELSRAYLSKAEAIAKSSQGK